MFPEDEKTALRWLDMPYNYYTGIYATICCPHLLLEKNGLTSTWRVLRSKITRWWSPVCVESLFLPTNPNFRRIYCLTL